MSSKLHEPLVVFETCREVVIPGAPGIVEGAKLVPVPNFGNANEVIEGLHAHFHVGCFPGEPYYRYVAVTEPDDGV